MAFPADAIDPVDLKALDAGGLVNEDVLQKIFQLSSVQTPFLDLLKTDTCENSYTEWVQDELGAAADTAAISGSDASTYQSATGARVGNHTQINRRTVAVSERARNTSNIGRGDELEYQTMLALQRLRQDVELDAVGRQASVADNNNNTAGQSGGFSAWIATNDSFGTDGVSGGFNTTTKVVDAPTAGDGRVLAFSLITAQVLNVYTQFGNITTLMTTPTLVTKLNAFLNAGSGVLRATPSANIEGSGGKVDQTAQGYFQVIVTEFGTTLTIVPNRIQAAYTSDTSGGATPAVDVLLIDPSMVGIGYLDGFKVKDLAKLGLSDRRDVSVDWTLKVYQEKSHAVIRDILPSGTVTA